MIIEGFFNPKISKNPDDGPGEYYEMMYGTAILKVEKSLRLETNYITTVETFVLQVKCVWTGVEFNISIPDNKDFESFSITLKPEL
jgi:hypothetical protein